MKRIKNCAELRRAIARGQYEYAILLAGGAMRSSKYITAQFLTGRELYTHSNIGKAMRKGAFIAD